MSLEFWVLALGVAVIAAVGVLRRDSLLTLAMTTGGFVILMLSLLWSQDFGGDGMGLVLLGAIGASIATLGTERSRREKRDSC
jgi:hypothetical protein